LKKRKEQIKEAKISKKKKREKHLIIFIIFITLLTIPRLIEMQCRVLKSNPQGPANSKRTNKSLVF